MLFRILLALYAAVGLAVQFVEDAKDNGKIDAPDARNMAILKVKGILTASFGFYPWWLPDALVGAAVDLAVKTMNEKGVFQHAADGSQDPALPAGGPL
jgi:hypothetical protein